MSVVRPKTVKFKIENHPKEITKGVFIKSLNNEGIKKIISSRP